MIDTSNIEITFNNPYTTEEFLKYLVKWAACINEQRFTESLKLFDEEKSEGTMK